MMKSILAALDGSPESLAALEQSLRWAERLGAELRVMAVQDERRFVKYPTYSDSEGMVPKPVRLEGSELKKAEAEAAQDEADLRAAYQRLTQGQGAHADLRIVRGPVEELLIREAHAADLVVLGKRGRAHDEHPAMAVGATGPTTEMLIHQALRPVLVVPRDAETAGPMLLPFDGSKGVQRVLVPAVQLAAAAGSGVVALTLCAHKADGEETQAPLRKYLAAHGVKAEYRVIEGRDSERAAARTILGAVAELKPGLIAMGAFSLSPLKEWLLGSVTREVLGHTRCPLLMMT
jgi:nucleotide-binding universal stress UspA family protein